MGSRVQCSEVQRFRVHRKNEPLSFRTCIIMLVTSALPYKVSPACHARHENILKEQVIGTVQGMLEETNGT